MKNDISSDNLAVWGFALFYVFGIIFSFKTYLGYGFSFFTLSRFLPLLAILVIVAMCGLQRIWVGLLLGVLPMEMSINLPLFDRFQYFMLVALAIIVMSA